MRTKSQKYTKLIWKHFHLSDKPRENGENGDNTGGDGEGGDGEGNQSRPRRNFRKNFRGGRKGSRKSEGEGGQSDAQGDGGESGDKPKPRRNNRFRRPRKQSGNEVRDQ